MTAHILSRTRIFTLALIWLGMVALRAGDSPDQLTTDEILQRVLKQAKWVEHHDLWNQYGFERRTVVQDFGRGGKVRERKEMWFVADEKSDFPRLKQVKINGKLLTGAEFKEEAQDQAKTRKALSPKKSPPKRDPGEIALSRDVVDRFHFSLDGSEDINGRPAYILSFAPKSAELPAKDMADELLNRLQGRLWVDHEDFEIARAEVSLRSEVKLWAGLLAVLHRFSLTVERVRVGPRVWFNRMATGDIEGRELVTPEHVRFEAFTSNYHRLTMPKGATNETPGLE
jgi:hypothetical protein